jgi:hypothetical protein
LREACENEEIAIEEYGAVIAKKLLRTLFEFRALQNVSLLFLGNPVEILYKELAAYKVNLQDNHSIILASCHIKTPMLLKQIDWRKVSRIIILSIEKNNE